MPLNVTVTANEAFADGGTVDRAALRRASKPTVSVTGQVSTADIAAAAGITFTQLASLADGSVLRGNGSAPVATALTGNASLTSGGVLTSSDTTVTAAKLVTAAATNVVKGLSAELTTVDGANDFVMIHDHSDVQLKKINVTNLLNAGVNTSVQNVTDLADLTTSATTATSDLNAHPVQFVEITNTAAATFQISNPPADATTAKSVSVIIKNSHSAPCVLTFSGSPSWTFLKSAPTTLTNGKTAGLAITAYSSSDTIVGYAAQD